MKDLKHLIFFEDLLQQANNQLVQQAVDQGQIALGYNCYYIPEVLLNLPGCFSSRLRAPRSASPDIASYYMTGRNCPYVRCILERAIEGGYNYLGALFGAECCAAMERMEEHFQLLHPVKNDRFFLTIIDPPMKGDQTSLDYYKAQLQLKVLDPSGSTTAWTCPTTPSARRWKSTTACAGSSPGSATCASCRTRPSSDTSST